MVSTKNMKNVVLHLIVVFPTDLDVLEAVECAREIVEKGREQGGVSGKIVLPAAEVEIV